VVYSGDSNFGSSASTTLTQTVNIAPTSTSLTSTVNPSNLDQTISLIATVSSQFTGTPFSGITFRDGGTVLATISGTGGATYSTSSLSIGVHTIIATYSGDANFASSSAAILQT